MWRLLLPTALGRGSCSWTALLGVTHWGTSTAPGRLWGPLHSAGPKSHFLTFFWLVKWCCLCPCPCLPQH